MFFDALLLPSWAVLGSLVAIGVLYCTYQRIIEETEIRRLGGHATGRWPWDFQGLRFTYQFVRYAQRNEVLKFLHNACMASTRVSSTARQWHSSMTYEVRRMGVRYIVTADPVNIKALLGTQFEDFGKGDRFLRDWRDIMGHSVFTTDGKAWHDARQRIRPLFTRQRIADLECFDKHVQVLLPMLGRGAVVDVKDLFLRFAIDTAADFSLGLELNTMRHRSEEFFEAFERVHETQSLIQRAGPFNFLISRKQFKRDLAVIDSILEPSIQEALNLPLEALEAMKKSDSSYTFVQQCAAISRDPVFLRDEIRSVMIAGRDTTSMTLTWCLFELARHPALVEELRRTIEDTIGFDTKPTYEDLKRPEMKLVSNILNETLRLYPSTPNNARAALRDTTLPRGGGSDGTRPIGIRAKTPILYSTHLMQLDDDIYPPEGPDFSPPQKFDPHRWDKWFPTPWTYIPFNGGPRICIGQAFALTEMSFVLLRIFQRFCKVELVSAGDGYHVPQESPVPWLRKSDSRPSLAELYAQERPKMTSKITLAPKYPVRVRFAE
ncbi:cytochrome P450 [Colletotrichum cereale]|nr:cytochrome P450 [Colletotrichum cereale]